MVAETDHRRAAPSIIASAIAPALAATASAAGALLLARRFGALPLGRRRLFSGKGLGLMKPSNIDFKQITRMVHKVRKQMLNV